MQVKSHEGVEMKFEFNSSRILVIYGPQGSGKNLAARKIAEEYGTFKEFSCEVFDSKFWAASVFEAGHDCVIFSGFPKESSKIDFIKAMSITGAASIEVMYAPKILVKCPKIIFCIQTELNPSRLSEGFLDFDYEIRDVRGLV